MNPVRYRVLQYYQQVCKISKGLVAICSSTVKLKTRCKTHHIKENSLISVLNSIWCPSSSMTKQSPHIYFRNNLSDAGFCNRAQKQCRSLLPACDHRPK